MSFVLVFFKLLIYFLVLCFALLGLLFDSISLAVFRICARAGPHAESRPISPHLAITSDDEAVAKQLPLSFPVSPKADDSIDLREDAQVRAHDLNMLSALLHVGSDLLRSATTLIEAIVILRHPRS